MSCKSHAGSHIKYSLSIKPNVTCYQKTCRGKLVENARDSFKCRSSQKVAKDREKRGGVFLDLCGLDNIMTFDVMMVLKEGMTHIALTCNQPVSLCGEIRGVVEVSRRLIRPRPNTVKVEGSPWHCQYLCVILRSLA